MRTIALAVLLLLLGACSTPSGLVVLSTRSPRGLAKGRFHLTLYLFLQKHYSSGSSSAWALTSYLESIDSGKRGAAKPRAAGTSRSSLRPPAAVPAR